MKKKFLLLPLIAGLFYISLSSNSSSPGASGSAINGTGATGVVGCGGGACHGSAATMSDSVTITLDSAGYPVSHYVAGRTYNIILTCKNTSTSFTLPRFGFQLTAVYLSSGTHYAGTGSAMNAGTLATTGLPSGCVTHNITATSFVITEHSSGALPATSTSTSGGYGTIYRQSIPWTAPASGSGTVVLYGVVNAVNYNGSADAGDKWNNDSTQISELVLPVAAITGPSSVCVGANITLSNATTGGTWGSLSPSIASVTTTGGVVRGNSAGTAVITYNAGSAGIAYDTITVVGPPSGGTISGPTQICRTTSVTLSTTVTGGTWSSSAPSIVSINSTTGVAYGVAIGTARISYTRSGSCGTGYSVYNDTVVNTITAGTISGPGIICPLASTTMTRTSGGGGGSWSSSNTSIVTINPTTGVATGLTTGSVTISYNISGACGSVTATTGLTVVSPPPAIAGPSSTCVNSPITLTDSVPSGLWSSSNTAVAIAAAGLGTVTGVSPGTAVITYTAPTGCFAIKNITVNRIPGPITGTTNVCPNATTTLADTSVGGTWIISDTTKAKFTGPGIVKGVAAGTVTVSYVFPTTGCYSSTSFTVNPNPAFIVGRPAICVTKTDSLSNYTGGGAWSATPTSVASIDGTGALYGVSGGTSSVTYTLPTGCYITRNIVIHPLPNPVITFDWYTNTFSVPSYYTSYQWYENSILVPGANLRAFSVALNGSYYVYVKDSFGCENRSADYVIGNLAVKNVDIAGQIKISPNPSSDFINIEAPVPLNAIITSVEGKVISQATNAKSINISSLANGVYMLLLYDEAGNKIAVNKFIKQ